MGEGRRKALLELEDDLADAERVARLGVQLHHLAGAQDALHLHRLNDRQLKSTPCTLSRNFQPDSRGSSSAHDDTRLNLPNIAFLLAVGANQDRELSAGPTCGRTVPTWGLGLSPDRWSPIATIQENQVHTSPFALSSFVRTSFFQSAKNRDEICGHGGRMNWTRVG